MLVHTWKRPVARSIPRLRLPIRGMLAFVPVLGLFAATAVVVLAAHAPRTWAQNWTAPRVVAPGSGQNEYGAVALPGHRWDLFWLDTAASSIVYTRQNSSSPSADRSYTVDRGDVNQPDIHGFARGELGVWVHNFNGSTALDAAWMTGGHAAKVFQLLKTPATIEHPHPFVGPGGALEVVFAWQHPSYDLFLGRINLGTKRFAWIKPLTQAQYYSFYPKVTVDGAGHIVTLHLESCCRQMKWDFQLMRYSPQGRLLGPPLSIGMIPDSGDVPQWGEDLQTDAHGNVWGAVTGTEGVRLAEISPTGKVLVKPENVWTLGSNPDTLALSFGRSGNFLFWQQPSGFGGWLAAAPLLPNGKLGKSERAVYEGGDQANPHAASLDGSTEVVWEDVTKYGAATFQTSSHESSTTPNLAERLGLGVGNIWEDVGLLVGGSVMVGALGVAANVIDVMVIIGLGILFMYLVRRLKQRWFLYSAFVAGLLFVVFVAPGGPLLFLKTLPASGLPLMPYGVLAGVAAFALMTWLSLTLLKHADDVYRGAVLVCAGTLFFAFIEAVMLIEGQLTYLG